MDLAGQLKAAIRSIPDYPKKGIVFRDLTTLWKDGKLMRRTTDLLYERYRKRRLGKILGIEARGFIVGAPLADRLSIGFIPARKMGKLPAEKVTMEYQLEYGKQGIEVHRDSIRRGERVLIVDDLLATGGTSSTAAKIVEKLGGEVEGFAFIAELAFIGGRRKLKGYDVYSIVKYNSEEE